MKINELIMNMHRKDFNMEKELKVKKYLPIEEKKLIAQGIIYECTENVDGVIKVDSVQRYLSYVKYMILRHTNLEYTQEDYDALCSTACGDTTLLNAIIECFGEDAKECSRILNLMMDDYMQQATMEYAVAKFLNNLGDIVENLADGFNKKIESMDLSTVIPKGMDANKLTNFLNTYVK